MNRWYHLLPLMPTYFWQAWAVWTYTSVHAFSYKCGYGEVPLWGRNIPKMETKSMAILFIVLIGAWVRQHLRASCLPHWDIASNPVISQGISKHSYVVPILPLQVRLRGTARRLASIPFQCCKRMFGNVSERGVSSAVHWQLKGASWHLVLGDETQVAQNGATKPSWNRGA
jgi:hypothetical protein